MIRQFKLSDIVYDEHKPVLSCMKKNIFNGKDLVNPITGKEYKNIFWDEIKRIEEVSENQRKDSVKEIKYIIKNMKKEKNKK